MVHPEILDTIQSLQKTKSLKSFYLAGGTNLAIRFQHRESEDIDLFCESIIGIKGFEVIKEELQSIFGKDIIYIDFPTKKSDELVFLRLILRTKSLNIKIEILQGFKLLAPIENFKGVNLASIEDIGTFKLESLANRFALKDLYDLDFITDKIKLGVLIDLFQQKKKIYLDQNIKTIFHFDNKICPVTDLSSLLDDKSYEKTNLPFHKQPHLIKNNIRHYRVSIAEWRFKVKHEINKKTNR